MSKVIQLNIKPFVVADLTHNVVRVNVEYSKQDTGPVATIQAAEVPTENDGSGFSSFKVVLFASPSAHVVVERGWKMNNAKRLQAARDQVALEISHKRGDTWAAIEKLLKESGSEIVESPVLEAVPA